MDYMLVMGIILAAGPIILLEVLAHLIFINMLRDDQDMSKVFSFGVGVVILGLVMIGIHFGVKFI